MARLVLEAPVPALALPVVQVSTKQILYKRVLAHEHPPRREEDRDV